MQGFCSGFVGMSSAWLRPNLGALDIYLRESNLDVVVLKPPNSQSWASLCTFAPIGLSAVVVGNSFAGWGAHQSGVLLTPAVLVSVMLMCVALIHDSLWFLTAATSIWFVKT